MKRLERESYSSKTQKSYFYFLCDCGNKIVARSDNKKEFCSKPGCRFSKRKMHGFGTKTDKLYRRWEGIISRCHGNHRTSVTYKDRGIVMCDEWRHDFTKFREWALENGFKDELTIDRINIDGNYEPSNCEWITRSENSRRQIIDGHGPIQTRKIKDCNHDR